MGRGRGHSQMWIGWIICNTTLFSLQH
jgi:hypothetical protein